MKSIWSVFILLSFLCSGIYSPAFGQKDTPALTLEDIYKNNVYSDKGYGPIRWSKDSKGYLAFETSTGVNGKDIVKYDAETGERSVVCSAKSLIPEGQTNQIGRAHV